MLSKFCCRQKINSFCLIAVILDLLLEVLRTGNWIIKWSRALSLILTYFKIESLCLRKSIFLFDFISLDIPDNKILYTILGFQNLRNGVLVMLWQACNLLSRFRAIFWVLAIWGIISVRTSLQGYKSHVRCHLLVNEELLHVHILRSWNWKQIGRDKTWGVLAVAWNLYLVIWWEHNQCRKCFNSP